MPTANKVPMGPSHKASIATNLESPLPIASFLKIYLAKFLKDSKIKKAVNEVNKPLLIRYKSIYLLSNKPINIKPKIPEKKPKFINPWGIQKLSISINAIQIKSDKNIQLKNKFKNKLEFDIKKEGELLIKIIKRIPVRNSTKGYLKGIDWLQCRHFLLCFI